jgi:regulator of sigma E protease
MLEASQLTIAALGLAILMIVHEGGHFLAARRFKMRVQKFSIGFGPTLYRHKPIGSPTTYQVAIIPFIAYVQIAGMNPYEEIDPNDKASYANASLWARFVTIAAGPLSNYFFASVLFFFGFLRGGVFDDVSMKISVMPDGPAQTAGMRDGDRVVAVNDEPIKDWEQLPHAIRVHAGEPVTIKVERNGEKTPLSIVVTPKPKGDKEEGKILIGPRLMDVTAGQAAVLSVTRPPLIVYELVRGIGRMIARKEKPELSGPVGIVRQTAAAVKSGIADYLKFLGMLSAYLGGFNLLPFPALDGGRLLFLGFEAASRRRPDAKIEARVHAVGLLMMLTLIAFVTAKELGLYKVASEESGEKNPPAQSQPAPAAPAEPPSK